MSNENRKGAISLTEQYDDCRADILKYIKPRIRKHQFACLFWSSDGERILNSFDKRCRDGWVRIFRAPDHYAKLRGALNRIVRDLVKPRAYSMYVMFRRNTRLAQLFEELRLNNVQVVWKTVNRHGKTEVIVSANGHRIIRLIRDSRVERRLILAAEDGPTDGDGGRSSPTRHQAVDETSEIRWQRLLADRCQWNILLDTHQPRIKVDKPVEREESAVRAGHPGNERAARLANVSEEFWNELSAELNAFARKVRGDGDDIANQAAEKIIRYGMPYFEHPAVRRQFISTTFWREWINFRKRTKGQSVIRPSEEGKESQVLERLARNLIEDQNSVPDYRPLSQALAAYAREDTLGILLIIANKVMGISQRRLHRHSGIRRHQLAQHLDCVLESFRTRHPELRALLA